MVLKPIQGHAVLFGCDRRCPLREAHLDLQHLLTLHQRLDHEAVGWTFVDTNRLWLSYLRRPLVHPAGTLVPLDLLVSLLLIEQVSRRQHALAMRSIDLCDLRNELMFKACQVVDRIIVLVPNCLDHLVRRIVLCLISPGMTSNDSILISMAYVCSRVRIAQSARRSRSLRDGAS